MELFFALVRLFVRFDSGCRRFYWIFIRGQGVTKGMNIDLE